MGTQVYTIEELKNMISKEDFDEIYENIKDRVEAEIEFTPEDLKKDFEELENMRKQKLEKALKDLKVHADRNLFAGGIIEISVDSIGYKTSAEPPKVKPVESKPEQTDNKETEPKEKGLTEI